ncbi:hypothetical protein PTSG_02693 [Salpingoeca rosetta]|uniref:Uncharacterized protein n=1 Tax=Salpingoeca rosetta (strain ATCC 50818 / BSB-021) TaxID=946362 RepID=F2U312_SALR5|nr:uncharacterized protein PTSG_02693 [Salpingoeca rosetta]EGD82006.1 hypothetical protein PTSG_02693 [Salpingoeca rosetta]|eukprot:XP_004996189.1 hypothetical protein PTSG_02693 [Salpingoeca rosetta]
MMLLRLPRLLCPGAPRLAPLRAQHVARHARDSVRHATALSLSTRSDCALRSAACASTPTTPTVRSTHRLHTLATTRTPPTATTTATTPTYPVLLAHPRRHITTGSGLRTTWMMRLLQFLNRAHWVSDRSRLEWFPPFFVMRVKVLKIEDGWRKVHMKLPLNTLSRNPGGVMFGGYQVAVADPVPAMACARVFKEYSCWTRAMTIDFVRGGTTDLEMRFEFPEHFEEEIRQELKEKGRATPTFHYNFYLKTGELCSRVTNTVAIRPKGYIKAVTPPASSDGF